MAVVSRLSHCRPAVRKALTLLELLVVLVILAIVATVAVNSLQPRVEAARFGQTQKLIANVQDSILGPRNSRQADGTPLVSGFVADVGRAPLVQGAELSNTSPGEPNEGMELRELWSADTSLARTYPFQFRSGPNSPVDYSDIQLPCGWRGPYLQLSIGVDSLRDPWGRPFDVQADMDDAVQTMIWRPVGSYDKPLASDLTSGKVSVAGAINLGESIPPSLEVVMLVPAPETSRTELVVLADEDNNASTFSFSQVPIGLRVVCVTVENQRVLTRYVNVTHQGISLVFDLTQSPVSDQGQESDE